jgi:hypothetical protein
MTFSPLLGTAILGGLTKKIQPRTSLQSTFVASPLGNSIGKPLAEPNFEQSTDEKKISPLNQRLLPLKTNLVSLIITPKPCLTGN